MENYECGQHVRQLHILLGMFYRGHFLSVLYISYRSSVFSIKGPCLVIYPVSYISARMWVVLFIVGVMWMSLWLLARRECHVSVIRWVSSYDWKLVSCPPKGLDCELQISTATQGINSSIYQQIRPETIDFFAFFCNHPQNTCESVRDVWNINVTA